MTEPPIISALVKRHPPLTGEQEHTQKQLRQMLVSLDNLDATILLFDKDYLVESIEPKGFRPASDWASRGEMSRIILSILRQASEPLTSRDIAQEL